MTIDELDVVRRLRSTDEPSAAARVAAARRLRARIDDGGPRRPRWLVVALAGAAAAIALLVVLAAGGEESTLRPAPADARQVLGRAAAAAERRADRALRPDEYWYMEERSRYMVTTADGEGYSAIVPRSRETWTGPHGHLRVVFGHAGKPEFFGPRDRARWEAAGRPDLSGGPPTASIESRKHRYTFGAKRLSYAELAGLPSDGRAMYERLIEGAGDAGSSPDQEAFTMIGDLLREAPVPPDVRAGLYRAAAHIRGVRLAGEVRDALGRRGLAVDLPTTSNTRQRLVFDPDTALLLAEQEVLTGRVAYVDAAPGTAIGERLVVRQGVVGSDRARP